MAIFNSYVEFSYGKITHIEFPPLRLAHVAIAVALRIHEFAHLLRQNEVGWMGKKTQAS